MPTTHKIPQLENEVKVTRKGNAIKRKTIKSKKSRPTVTEDMIAKAAYYKAEQRGFTPGFEERDWLEAEVDLKSELRMH